MKYFEGKKIIILFCTHRLYMYAITHIAITYLVNLKDELSIKPFSFNTRPIPYSIQPFPLNIKPGFQEQQKLFMRPRPNETELVHYKSLVGDQ